MESIWKNLADQCAPVLTDVKPSNLLILTSEEEKSFLEAGLPAHVERLLLYSGEHKFIWFVYRPDRLEAKLVWPSNREFLSQYGYFTESVSLEASLNRLRERFHSYKKGKMEFPHEMGIFLGYPIEDVKGFIQNEGKNFRFSGYWKVYGNEEKARKTFELYHIVRAVLSDMVARDINPCEISYQTF